MFQKLKVSSRWRTGKHWLYSHDRTIVLVSIFAALVLYLLLHRLTQLPTSALSPAEQNLTNTPIGLHGILTNPFFLASKLQLTAAIYWFGHSSSFIARLPSVKLGALAIICMAIVIRTWHGTKAAVLGCLLFACSAWVLHVSRYASFDSLYLLSLPLILVGQLALERLKYIWVPYIVLLSWGILLYTPGLIWFIIFAAYRERNRFQQAWVSQRLWWQRGILGLCAIAWLPLMVQFFIRQPRQLIIWLGAPLKFDGWPQLLHRLTAVPLHLFVHGPAIPERWLGQLPILDVFTLVVTVLGFAYYLRHWRSGRSRLLLMYSIIGTIVIGLGGSADISLLIPLVYLAAAAGIAGLSRDWRQRFPLNPVLRAAGTIVLTVVVLASCAYNLQSYFVAWPHDQATLRIFKP